DLLKDGETGLLVPDDDDEAMAAAILRLLHNPDLASRLSSNGRKLAESFSWQQIRPQWEKLFADALARENARRPWPMWGICGIVSPDRPYPIAESALLAMRDSLIHRGPDGAGHYLAPGIALGSRRLAVLDLSERGRMPMSTPDARYRIIYNGEVYN